MSENLYKEAKIPYKELKERLELLSALGSGHAMSHLAKQYTGWDASDVDKKKGLEYLTRSAEMGYVPSMVELGDLYAMNDKLGDRKLAESWYKKGVAGGKSQGNV